jgi:hypothetical protein
MRSSLKFRKSFRDSHRAEFPALEDRLAQGFQTGGPTPRCNHACSSDERFDFIHREHDGREIEACTQPISNAGLSLDWDAGD